jgi:flagellar hook-basal body complex protein FliE
MLANSLAGVSNTLNSVPAVTAPFSPSASTPGAPFSNLLKDAISNVQSLEDQAASSVQGLMSGRGVDVHQAMIATQKSEMAFEMTLSVRNKAIAAYQQLMQMQF